MRRNFLSFRENEKNGKMWCKKLGGGRREGGLWQQVLIFYLNNLFRAGMKRTKEKDGERFNFGPNEI